MGKSKENASSFLPYFISTAFVIILLFASCENEKKDVGKYDPSQKVVIDQFYPDSGRIADKVIFTGSNFGTDPSIIKVYFNQKLGKVVGSDGSSMYVVVPRMPGDTCQVAVVVGNDSVVCERKFRYKMSVTVSTVCGNGEAAFKAGTLSSAQIRPRYLCVDSENNIFAIQRDDGTSGLIRINEDENIVTLIQSGLNSPNALCVDLASGIVTVPADEPYPLYYDANPSEGWAVRSRTVKYNSSALENVLNDSYGRYKHAMAFCAWDGYVYVRYRGGYLVKINPKTYEGSSVVTDASNNPLPIGSSGDSYGVTFHPHHPSLLYIAFTGECGDMAHAIYTIDVAAADPLSTMTRLTAPGTASGGFRDGRLEQAIFNNPRQMYFDSDGYLYIADYGNHCIRRITPQNMVETVVGIPGTSGYKDGNKDEALFRNPWGLGVSKDGNVYVADHGNNRIRKLAVE